MKNPYEIYELHGPPEYEEIRCTECGTEIPDYDLDDEILCKRCKTVYCRKL